MADLFDLHYGAPGSAKTRSLMEVLRKLLADNPSKLVRVYTGDGSKIMYELAVKAGLFKPEQLKIMDFIIRQSPFTTCQQITEGWWPENENDPASKMKKLTAKEVEQTCAWIFEGASVMGNYMLGDAKGGLAQRAADGEVIGQESNIRITDDADYKFGGNAPAHYGLAQRHLLQNILRSKALPGYVGWTAHERVDDGERGGGLKPGQGDKVRISDKQIGAELVGKALTGSISREFMNTLHYMIATKKTANGTDPVSGKTQYVDKTEYRVYTRPHYDPDGIVSLQYQALNRAIHPDKVKDFYVSDTPGAGLLAFYEDFNLSNSAI